jgi:glycerol-3-phosphate dehydrogenase
MTRSAAFQRLQTETFDVCFIGGGATGAGCALDAALRGLKVVLIERDDFAAQTSSKSTKLIHGGVRYLEEAVKKVSWAQFQMVRKSLAERSTLLRNAPHLTRPLALLTPCANAFEAAYLTIGLKLYDWLAGSRSLQSSRWLSRQAALRRVPQLDGTLHSAVLYFDGQLDDARYALALAQSAARAGAVVLNHAEALEFEKTAEGKLRALHVRDTLSGETYQISARAFVNATGPFADAVRTRANADLPPRLRVSRGSHVVLGKRYLPGDTAILVPKTDDGRVLFLIPWHGRVLVGTTDLEDELQDNPQPRPDEQRYLLDYVNRYLREPVPAEAIQAGFTGQRPLIQPAETMTDTKSLVRDHEVEIDPRSGLISILGGKWTTYRLMASDTVDAVLHALGQPPVACRTEHHVLVGGEGYRPEHWRDWADEYGFPEEIGRHLNQRYGTQARTVAELTRADVTLREPLVMGYPFLKAEVVYAARQEWACTPDDVLFRRLGLGLLDAEATARARPVVEALLQRERASVTA